LDKVDFTNRGHIALSALNPFYFWFLGVIAVSISVLAGVSWKKAAVWSLGVWVLHRALLLAIPGTGGWIM
jgi:hypothetical protein